MARVNIYVPDGLARRAREAGLNVSGIAQAALERELRRHDNRAWFHRVLENPPLEGVTHDEVIRSIDEAREEMGRAADEQVDPDRHPGDLDPPSDAT
jgi:post-segregation antitoxin (ccd killing protein)